MSDDLGRRARSFGEQAELYDRARPSYPAALLDWLLAEPAPRVLDVGCGTGKAGVLFAARGCTVLGVEPDAQMAAVARGHGLEVEVAQFEEWDPAGRRFELAICAQAWHWLDHERAVSKLAEAVEPGGRFAPFWNFSDPDEDSRALLAAAYSEHAPELTREESVARGGSFETAADRPEGWASSDIFSSFEVRTVDWDDERTAAEWVELLATHSDHALLPKTQREDLFAAIETAFAGRPPLRVHYRTRVVIAHLR